MKLRNKSKIAIALVAFLFLSLSFIFFETTRHSYLNLFILSAVTFLFVAFLIQKLIIKNIEELAKNTKKIINHNDLTNHLKVKDNDETAETANQFNQLIDKINALKIDFEQELEAANHVFKNENIALKQALSERTLLMQEKKNVIECLTQIARYDDLTSLPNKVFFNEILNKSISHAKRHHKTLAVLLIDIDNFKTLYTQLGEMKSNLILKELGSRLARVLRSEDIIAKLDGDEFIILLNDIGKPKFASKVAQKVLDVCGEPIKIDSYNYLITSCIGISICPHDANSLEEVLINANNALFKAKRTGQGTYQFYTHEMSIEAREYIELESALRKAVHSNELVLYYQPKYRIKTGTITGVQALMRWEHPVLGIVNPSTFIPHAEETGYIMQIGEWALREACKKAKFWQDEGYEHINVSIKLSSKQFHHSNITKIITDIVKQTEINPKYIELEIDENTLMTNVDEARVILDKIKATGVEISIDHFGVGYTSISHLKKFPISTIKIDQSYIKGIPEYADDCAIVSAMIALAHHLGVEVVAEGVETAEQVQFLTQEACDIIQGYFLGSPLPAPKVILQFTKLRDEVLI